MIEKWITRLVDFATFVICFVSAWTTADGLATIMDSKIMAYSVAIGIGIAMFSTWIMLNHWYPDTHSDVKRRAWIGIIVFCLLVLIGSTQFTVLTTAGKEAVGIHEQKVLDEANEQAIVHLRQGEREVNLVAPLRTYRDIFADLSKRETKGELSGLDGSGLVVANLKTQSEAFENFAKSVESTNRERQASYARLQQAINEGRDLIIQQKQYQKDNAAFQQSYIAFAGVTSNINKELAKMASLDSMRFLKEANNNLEGLTQVIGHGNNAQNKANNDLRQPVEAAKMTLSKVIDDNKSLEIMAPPTFTIIPMGFAIWRYAWFIGYAWALGLLLDFLPALFLHFKALAMDTVRKQEAEARAARREARKKEEQAQRAKDKASKP